MTLNQQPRHLSRVVRAFTLSMLLSLPAIAAQNSERYDEAEATYDLRVLLAQRPSLNVIFDAERINKAAQGILSDKRIHELTRFMQEHNDRFIRAHRSASAAVTAFTGKKAVVSGASISGLVAAAILSKAGYDVEVFEMRPRYTRNIQWAGRQGLVNQLATIDQVMAEKFLTDVAKPIEKGAVDIYADGRVNKKKRASTRTPDPMSVPQSGEELMTENSAVILEARVYEQFLKNYVLTLPRLKFTQAKLPKVFDRSGHGDYQLEGRDEVDLIVVAEGPNSSTRHGLGIQSVAASPRRLQIAGLVHVERGGEMIKHRRLEQGPEGPEIYLTGTMSRLGSGKTWVVTDVVESKITPDPRLALRLGTKEYNDERQRLINDEFIRHSGEALGLTSEQMRTFKIDGPVEGSQPAAFTLEQHVATAASAGSDVAIIGDAVNNGHWSVGGGMQMAAVSHGERLKTLLLDLDLKLDKRNALEKFGRGVQQDSLAWLVRGIRDFYPQVKAAEVSKLFESAVAEWQKGQAASPFEAMRPFLADGGRSTEIKLKRLTCPGIFTAEKNYAEEL